MDLFIGYAIVWSVILVVTVLILIAPWWIATKRDHPHANAILVLGIVGGLLGVIGWIGALVWAFITPVTGSEALRKIKANPDVADELMKFKTLCDQGIITVNEFELKKAQLLGVH